MCPTGYKCSVFFIAGMFFISTAFAQSNTDSATHFSFIKKELNTGAFFTFNTEREELRTQDYRHYEDLSKAFSGLRFENRNWIYLPHRQEKWSYSLEAGPFAGSGDYIDSSRVKHIDAVQDVTGMLGSLQGHYSGRYYIDRNHYTLVSISAWTRYEIYRQSARGTITDSTSATTVYDEKKGKTTFRNGIRAKAGWGTGRLIPVNHYATAEWLLMKYYPGRIFSEEEVEKVTRKIAGIKHQRNARTGHAAEKEWKELGEYLKKELFLTPPEGALTDWQLTEYRPRFRGSRLEAGPFFNYFNKEPDFIYGGYVNIESHRYCGLKRNRLLEAGISYNRYKKNDWMLLETALGWNFYPNLKTEYGIGLKYVSGMAINGSGDMGPLRHHFVPYLEYYKQLNPAYRIEASIAWSIAPVDQFMLPGPELTVSIYRSRY
jgi:hypothetical protein